ncbi:PREDICTED: uncharacterized protein LOC104814367 isoform X2 [Tarenaya hassleriana]|uniref:uncharacterized protein LOC104814367 isoform X2 n=1 Tax=Tarenaya hassleriana TaxID=28532 RepID=UPI00053C14BE|nr:PREDICTED: uncharacterized protein LOC104814367 isoform X2 [Tarenaya hassleriana]
MTDGVAMREYRKGNWTVSETMVLIEAKKMDDDRRLRRSIGLSAAEEHDGGRGKPAELRWKWIEDYCWSKGCLRSQNQCNDKWDNLMRDYKKIRELERRTVEESSSASASSYWKMEKSERKERNLPSNMLSEIYYALVEVVGKKGLSSGSGDGGGVSDQIPGFLHQSPTVPLPPPLSFHAQPILPTVDTSSPAKRRRRSEAEAGPSGDGGGAPVTEESGGSDAVGEAISKSASVIADAIRACEERQDKRHRETVNFKERMLKIEESKAEVNRQSMNGRKNPEIVQDFIRCTCRYI